MKKITILGAAALALAACSKPVASDQDGSELWLTSGRSYEEVLASVRTNVEPSLGKEE